ncbi:hypothetical protein REJC140_04131 [Pseudorhizobium endolithicum]|uniref:Uncharacterized protein n=1 Tax=Pseudorhizobium endolithicum TaxID=1191678 RepID=A0ABM8PT08_9HYPH|nr:hypothetical protein [Pseudorhizobium endolithicum]CAD6416503.1 adenylosuccinate synthase [Rhizobium sp. Q54]CAD7046747.1 hypothetical protein REJC140_04131 [Pseudorhizobium endolithicum]
MNLRVIEGGRRDAEAVDLVAILPARADEVRREADRRLRALDYERLSNRERMTGVPVPREIRYLAMQINFVADTLSALGVIPADFRSDRYWPAYAPLVSSET